MEAVLGVSMSPSTVRVVLVEGENADGVAIDADNIERTGTGERATRSGSEQVISAILGTRQGAAESGYALRSIGVTWADPDDAAALHHGLAAHDIENVTLMPALVAAAALTQEFSKEIGNRRTTLLFVERYSATVAVVDAADGSFADLHRRLRRSSDLVAELVAIVSAAQAVQTRPDGLFVVGSGVDIAPIKPALEAATSLAISTPEEPEIALAKGAALASAYPWLSVSSTTALAYARDPSAGTTTTFGVAPGGYFNVPAGAESSREAVAYSAVADYVVNAHTRAGLREDVTASTYPDFGTHHRKSQRRSLAIAASAVAVVFIVGIVALVTALAMSIRGNVDTPAPAAPAPASVPQAPTDHSPRQSAQPPDRKGHNESGEHTERADHSNEGHVARGHDESRRHSDKRHGRGNDAPGY